MEYCLFTIDKDQEATEKECQSLIGVLDMMDVDVKQAVGKTLVQLRPHLKDKVASILPELSAPAVVQSSFAGAFMFSAPKSGAGAYARGGDIPAL